MDPNCIIIKKKELEELQDRIKTNKEYYELEIKELKKKLQDAEAAVKPDEIKVYLYDYAKTSIYTNLNLSEGIRNQLLRILNSIKDRFLIRLESKVDKMRKENVSLRKKSEQELKDKLKHSLKSSFKYRFIYDKFTIFNKIDKVFE